MASVQRYEICDPQSAISMSEAYEMVVALDGVFLRREEDCVCAQSTQTPRPRNCWYKLAFAFLKTLPLPKTLPPPGLPSAQSDSPASPFSHPPNPQAFRARMCFDNASSISHQDTTAHLSEAERAGESGQIFADIVR